MALSESAKLAIKISAENTTDRAFNQLGSQLGRLKTAALALGGALASGLALQNLVEETRRWGEELDMLTDNLGVSAEQAGQLNAIGRVLGVGTDELARGFTIFGGKVLEAAESVGKGTSSLEKYGITFQDAEGRLLGFTDILANVRERLGQMDNSYIKSAIAKELFGRGASKLHDLLALTNEEFARLDTRTRNIARIMGGPGVAAMEQMNRSQRSLALGLTGLKLAIGVPLLESLDGLTNMLADLAFAAMPALEAAARGVLQVFRVVGGFILSVAQLFATLARRVAEASGFMRLFQGFTKGAREVLRAFLGMLKEVTEKVHAFRRSIDELGLVGALQKLAEDAPAPLQGLGEAVGLGLEGVRKALSGDFSGAIESFKLSLGKVGEALDGPKTALAQLDLATQFGVAFAAAGTAINGAIAGWRIAAWITTPLRAAGLALAGLIGGWPALVAVGLIALATVVVLNLDKIVAWLGENAPRFAEWLGRAKDVVMEKAGQLWHSLTGWLRDTAWPALVEFFTVRIPQFAGWILDSIPEWMTNLGRLVGDAIQWLVGTGFPNLLGFMLEHGIPTLWTWITEGVPKVLGALGSLLLDILDWARTAILRLGGALLEGGVSMGVEIVKGLGRGLLDLGAKLAEWIGNAIRQIRIDIGPFHLSADGFRIDMPQVNLSPATLGGGPRLGGVPNESFPGLAHGGIALPVPGGQLVRVAEAGRAEAIVPLPRGGGFGGITVVNHIAGSVISERDLERFIRETLVRDLRLTRQTA